MSQVKQIPPFTSTTEEFEDVVDRINLLRKNIAASQTTLDKHRKEYKEVIECENMVHEKEVNAKLIAKLTEERDQLQAALNNKQNQGQQQYDPQQQQTQQTQQQYVPQQTQQPQYVQQPQYSQEAMMITQTLKMNVQGINIDLAYEGPLNIQSFVQNNANAINDLMIMWKTREGYFCGGCIKFGWYLCYIGGNIYSFSKRGNNKFLNISFANMGEKVGLSYDNCIYIFDDFLFYNRNIDAQYQNDKFSMISCLLSGQQQLDYMNIPIEKFLVFRVY